MRIQNIKVDTKAIATGIYDMFDENEQAATAFGMLPFEKMKVLERELGNKIERIAKDAVEKKYGFRPNVNVAEKDLKSNFVRESMHHITVEIFRCAELIGKMVV